MGTNVVNLYKHDKAHSGNVNNDISTETYLYPYQMTLYLVML